ncbi:MULTISPECIES: hypothetical protein [unclassified Ensifer]|uniref:hypothetical protein n=1 Tax=unclassified Ensifer TaxID=2633371 RepID=UPI0015A10F19|nr:MULTISPECIES: hypothetical protein [unclassified Ensifer]MBD9596704.1 hypothetical protein [Ensifer sp. ENS05]
MLGIITVLLACVVAYRRKSVAARTTDAHEDPVSPGNILSDTADKIVTTAMADLTLYDDGCSEHSEAEILRIEGCFGRQGVLDRNDQP